MKKLFTLIFVLVCSIGIMQAQSWDVYDGSVVPNVLNEWAESSNDPGPNFVEAVMEDPDVPGNMIFQYIQADELRLDGTPKARKYYKYKFQNEAVRQVTVVTRMKGIQIDSLADELVMQIDCQVPWRDVISLETDTKNLSTSRSGGDVTLDIDLTEWHVYRITIDATGNVAVYIDEDPVPVHTGVSSEETAQDYVRFGDAGSARVAGYTDWFIVDSSGVYAPGEGAPIPDSCSIASGADAIVVPSGGSIQSWLDAAPEGGVVSLESGGIYDTHDLTFLKSVTLKAVDGASVRPVVNQRGSNANIFGEQPTGAKITLKGIEFSSDGSRYFTRLEPGDSLSKLEMVDIIAHGYDRSVIRASNGPVYVDTISIDNSHFYNFKGGGYRLFYLKNNDNTEIKQFKITNSTIAGFDRNFIKIQTTDAVEVIIDQCNIHGRTAAKDDDMFEVTGPAGSTFDLTNSIISGDKNIAEGKFWDIDDAVEDNISNVYFHDILVTDVLTKNTWTSEAAVSATDPLYSNPDEGALYLDAASPALTASTTGGVIGDPRWATAPAKASLLSIKTDIALFSFSTETLDYEVSVPYGTAAVEVSAVANFSDATIAGTGTVDVSSGTGTATVVVTGGDASTMTYTLVISQVAASNDARLSGLTPDVGMLDPMFDPAVLAYTLEVPAETDSVFFDYSTSFGGMTTVADTDTVDVQSGSGTATFVVTAEDGTTEMTYTVAITVKVPSSDATLSDITLSVGTLDPVFASGTYAYTAEVPIGTTSVTLVATATDAMATLAGDGDVDVSSGSGTATIVVTAEDGSTQNYEVVITVLVGVEQIDALKASMYHNSISEHLYIMNASKVEAVEIYSITGRKIHSMKAYNNESLEISTASFTNGVYVVRMKFSDNKIQTGKFVK